MTVRITQLDGKLPNLALMKLSHWHKSNGDSVYFSRSANRDLFEPEFDKVYGSSIFGWSSNARELFAREFPSAQVGGTGTESKSTVEEITGDYEHYDYSIYPSFPHSIGFSQRGCRLNCSFCVVPKKEGRVKEVNSIADIYRGAPHPKNILLLDNDFFGQPHWRERCSEIKEGDFKVCFNQGINIRLINKEGAETLATLKFRDDQFQRERIYTAWDNRKDEDIFMRGIRLLLDAGINANRIMVYFLCGYWPGETMDDVFYRFNKMVELGLRPYPMVFDNSNKTLKKFQRWVLRRYYEFIEWEDFKGKL